MGRVAERGAALGLERFAGRAARLARVVKMGACLFSFCVMRIENSRMFLFSAALFLPPAWFFPLEVDVSSVQEFSVENRNGGG